MIAALLVGIGGAAGALARFALDQLLDRLQARRRQGAAGQPSLPPGTLLVNVAGSLLIGVVYGLTLQARLSPEVLTALAAGLAGGLTTFSTWTVATVSLWQRDRRGAAVVNAAAHLIAGLTAVWCGAVIVGAL